EAPKKGPISQPDKPVFLPPARGPPPGGALENQLFFVLSRPAGRVCSIAFRPASVIFMRTTSTGRPPATIRSGVAIARPAMHRSSSRGTGKPCASISASVTPSGAPARERSAGRRSLRSRCARDGIGRLPPWVGVSNACGIAAGTLAYHGRQEVVRARRGFCLKRGLFLDNDLHFLDSLLCGFVLWIILEEHEVDLLEAPVRCSR